VNTAVQVRAGGWLLGHFALGAARLQPGRALIQFLAIATGVALGFAVDRINASALDAFSAAQRSLSGKADLTLTGAQGVLDESWYPRIAADPAVAIAAPVLEIDATLVDRGGGPQTGGAPQRGRALHIAGIDALRSAVLNPDLLGHGAPAAADPDPGQPGLARILPLLAGGLFLSPAALSQLHLAVGQSAVFAVGDHELTVPIAGTLPFAQGPVGAMDLGFAQWRFERLGELTRIDVKFRPGTSDADLARAQTAWQLPAGIRVERPQMAIERDQGLSRSYRVNLTVLSMVALFTGAFLVFSLQSQAIVARRAQLALLRMLGATTGTISRMLLGEALLLGVLGAALGLAGGAALAALALRTLGGDLGGGYFSGAAPPLQFDAASTAVFFLLGLAAAMGGAWLPARDAARQAPAPALKAGQEPAPGSQRPRAWTAVAGFALAAVALAVPPPAGMPLGAYAAIALVLLSTIALKPLLAPALFGALAARVSRSHALVRIAPAWLAATRLARLPRFAAVGAAGIVASFALMVAMATMVGSFRASFDAWLSQVLAADLYVRASPAGDTGRFSPNDLAMLAADPDVARAQFSHIGSVLLDPARAPVALIARPMRDADNPLRLPLVGREVAVPAGAVAVWVSEAMVDLYGARPGTPLALPLGPTAGSPKTGSPKTGSATRVQVAGVWRDYARQGGSIVIDVDDYARISGDASRTDAALWLRPGADAHAVAERLLARLSTPAAQIVQPGQIRALSLRLFDRSFQVTYLLEWAAIAIGLVGLATTFSAQAIARTREFGMLRHLGVTRRQVLGLLAAEALLVTALAALLGLAAGLGIAAILVRVVNPQSFHWTMEMHVPLGLLASLTGALLLAAALTSTLAGRRALSIDAVRAVKDDW
jgi:putative ABC transport system permease protein